MFSWFKKFKYETVATRLFTIIWTGPEGETVDTDKITYVCKVNGFQKRKVDIHTSKKVILSEMDKNNDMYHNSILPWLEKDPEKGYADDPEDDPDEQEPKITKKGNLITLDDKRKNK